MQHNHALRLRRLANARRNAETNRAVRRELFHIEPSWRK